MMPYIWKPLILQTCSSKIQQESQFMIADMQIIDKLRFIFSNQFGDRFQFNAYLVITQEIIVKVMCKNCSMKIQRNMCLTNIRHMIFN